MPADGSLRVSKGVSMLGIAESSTGIRFGEERMGELVALDLAPLEDGDHGCEAMVRGKW